MKFTIRQFNDRFPTSDACLEELKQLRFSNWTCPKCSRLDMLSKITGRPQYACVCGYQVAPLAGTIFHKSSSDLRDWFYAMYLMTQTRAGISAKQLERELGCTYKTAWRMFKQIRSLMAENDGNLLTGIVEVDETYVGGRKKGMQGGASNHKGVVMGMVERGTGRVRTEVIAKASTPELARGIRKHVSKEATLMTDEHRGYQPMLRVGYQHWSVNHQ